MKTTFLHTSIASLAFALIAVPAFVIAQSSVTTTIDTPEDGVTVEVGETVSYQGSATGGFEAEGYTFNWSFDGDEQSGPNQTYAFSSTGSKTVTLRAIDALGELDTDSITVNVVEAGDDLQILSVDVPEELITETTAVVRWTTNLPSTSRVIYDSQSHQDISGENAPNYGYAFTTGPTDTDPMVTEHEVTVSGLSPNTQYFFRVISTR